MTSFLWVCSACAAALAVESSHISCTSVLQLYGRIVQGGESHRLLPQPWSLFHVTQQPLRKQQLHFHVFGPPWKYGIRLNPKLHHCSPRTNLICEASENQWGEKNRQNCLGKGRWYCGISYLWCDHRDCILQYCLGPENQSSIRAVHRNGEEETWKGLSRYLYFPLTHVGTGAGPFLEDAAVSV